VNWNSAAAGAVLYIFGITHDPAADLAKIRNFFDAMISECWLKDVDPDVATSAWGALGALALATGRNAGVFPEGEEFSEKVVSTLVRKQTDYGHNNIARFGNNGLLVRVHDKIARLENLTSAGGSPQNESIFDNFLDLIGYSAIGMMWNQETFLLPLASTVAESA
jgi:hypothetical protein